MNLTVNELDALLWKHAEELDAPVDPRKKRREMIDKAIELGTAGAGSLAAGAIAIKNMKPNLPLQTVS